MNLKNPFLRQIALKSFIKIEIIFRFILNYSLKVFLKSYSHLNIVKKLSK